MSASSSIVIEMGKIVPRAITCRKLCGVVRFISCVCFCHESDSDHRENIALTPNRINVSMNRDVITSV